MKNLKIKLWTFSVSAFLCVGVINVSNHGFRMLQEPEIKVNAAAFNFYRNSIIATVYIKEEGPFNFVVDTGVHPSQISLPVARKLGLKIGPKGGNVLGLGSLNLPYYPTTIKEVRIGDLVVGSLEAIASEIPPHVGEGPEIHGVLGYSFLKKRVTSINYEKEALTFYSRLPRAVLREMSTSDLVKFPMTLAGGKIPILPNLTIKGRKVAAWIDTGANFNIGMSESDAKQLGLKELDFPNGKSTASGSRGVFEIRRVHVLDMAVGPLKKDSVVGITHNQGMSNVVGNAFFKDYVLTLDYIDRMVYLESGK